MPGKTALRVSQFLLLLIVAAVVVFGRKHPTVDLPVANVGAQAEHNEAGTLVLRRQPINRQSRPVERTLMAVPSRRDALTNQARTPVPSVSPTPYQGQAAGIATDRQVRRHRIVEGDTIHNLAQQYLGDSRRAVEIVAINSQLLSHPEILPLGKYLIIPPAAASSQPRMPATSDAGSASRSVPPYVDQSPRPLLPVP